MRRGKHRSKRKEKKAKAKARIPEDRKEPMTDVERDQAPSGAAPQDEGTSKGAPAQRDQATGPQVIPGASGTSKQKPPRQSPKTAESKAPPAGESPEPGKEPSGPPPGMYPGQAGVPPGPGQPPGYVYPVPWYPYPYFPAGPGYGQPVVRPGAPGQAQPPTAGQQADQTTKMPVVPPPVVPVFPPGSQPPGVPPVLPQPPGVPPVLPQPPEPYVSPGLTPLEEEEFTELTHGEPSHWRGDLKWLFGIAATLLIFLALALAGAFRVTGAGTSKEILVPLLREATEIEQSVDENYQELRSRARRNRNSSIRIPDIGVNVSIDASEITQASSSDLSEMVVLEVSRLVYANGYDADIPTMEAKGVGEERAKAMVITIMSTLNSSTQDSLLWPMIIVAVLAGLSSVVFILFCRGWGRAIGLGIVIIAASLPMSLFIRASTDFIWVDAASGTYKEALYEALRSIGSLSVVFFDVALGLGALVLVIGVIGNTVSKRTKRRVPPFMELDGPQEAVVGGPSLGSGLEAPEQRDAGQGGDPGFEDDSDLKP